MHSQYIVFMIVLLGFDMEHSVEFLFFFSVGFCTNWNNFILVLNF